MGTRVKPIEPALSRSGAALPMQHVTSRAADAFHDATGAAAIRAALTLDVAVTVTHRANVFASAGRARRGFVTGVDLRAGC